MKAITKYVADDGSEWDDPSKASMRDVLHFRCINAMSPLGDEPKGLGEWQFKQHSKDSFDRAKSGILAILREMPAMGCIANIPDEQVSANAGGGVAYTLSGNDTPVSKAWNRLGRISEKTYREYNQPYFAVNEERAPLEDPHYDSRIASTGTQR